MKDYKRIAFGSIAAASLALGGAASALAADVPNAAEPTGDVAGMQAEATQTLATVVVTADALEGTFAWDQATNTPNATIASTFRGATAALCGATTDFAEVNPLEWQISVTGDVDNAFTATVDEMAAEESVNQNMTCTCGGNPADGKAIVNADVKGIPVTYLIERANPADGANTVTFVCSDGTEQAFPLGYVIGRHAVISYEVNGEDLSASVGGNNQLWMTATPANYFVRDVVEVRITKEDVPPANPGEGAEHPNSPNVGMTASSVA